MSPLTTKSWGPAEESDAEGYVTAFENAIAAQPDAILTATLNIDPTIPKAKEATDAGIILNFVNCGLGNGNDGAHSDKYNEFYYCSNTTIGEMAARHSWTRWKPRTCPLSPARSACR